MRVEIYKKFLVWRVRIVAKNNRVMVNSEAYYSKSNAERAGKGLAGAIGATLKVIDGANS